MSDFLTGTYTAGLSSSGNFTSNSGIDPSAIVPYQAQSDGGFMTTITDDLSGAASYIFGSFVSGVGALSKDFASNPGKYIGDQGTIVGYDRLGNPIYRVQDPRTGAWTTSSTPAWPGGGGSVTNNPERVPQSYPSSSLWGWLVNSLGLPAPQPQAQIGVVPLPQNTANVVPNSQGSGGMSIGLPQVALGLGAAFVAFTVIRGLVK